MNVVKSHAACQITFRLEAAPADSDLPVQLASAACRERRLRDAHVDWRNGGTKAGHSS